MMNVKHRRTAFGAAGRLPEQTGSGESEKPAKSTLDRPWFPF
jgi:hypothetical protein